MSGHAHTDVPLTRNQSLVMQSLARTGGPLSAYAILDMLRGDGFRAPLQVYRALDRLVELGLVHRLESLNAFVACAHPDCDVHETTAFMICSTCGAVSEIADDELAERLGDLARKTGFEPSKTTIELRGICRECRKSQVQAPAKG